MRILKGLLRGRLVLASECQFCAIIFFVVFWGPLACLAIKQVIITEVLFSYVNGPGLILHIDMAPC